MIAVDVMSGRTNWSRIQQRRLMRRQGVEDIKVVVQPPKQPRRKLSKAELREQAAAACARAELLKTSSLGVTPTASR
jgi:hypothetical protein